MFTKKKYNNNNEDWQKVNIIKKGKSLQDTDKLELTILVTGKELPDAKKKIYSK